MREGTEPPSELLILKHFKLKVHLTVRRNIGLQRIARVPWACLRVPSTCVAGDRYRQICQWSQSRMPNQQLTLSLTWAFAVISSLTNMFVRTHTRRRHPRREARTRKLRQFAWHANYHLSSNRLLKKIHAIKTAHEREYTAASSAVLFFSQYLRYNPPFPKCIILDSL